MLEKTFKERVKLRKVSSFMFLVVILSVSFNAKLALSQSTMITVPDDFSTIQGAVDAANLGDTIFVRSGTYHERVLVNKTVSIIGENRESTIIRGDRVNNVVDITAENVTVLRFTITDSGPDKAGINITESSGSYIAGNEIFNNYFGVSISGRVGTIYWDGKFVEIRYPADWNVLENNLIHSNGYGGVYLSMSSNNTFRNNTILSNKYGIVMHESLSGDNIFVANNISLNDDNGICISGSNNTVVENTVLSNVNNGIVITGHGNVIKDNIISSSNIHGIFVYESNNNTFEGNTISSINEDGIGLYGSENNFVFNNTLFNNNQGMDVGSCTNTNITQNRVLNNIEGLHIQGSRNNILVANKILNNTKGVELEDYSDENVFSGNVLSGNDVAITLSSTMYNSFLHNNFMDNIQQVSSSDSQNTWDDGYPSGGNYWNDYGGFDTDGDGVGEMPYVLDADNQDNYPFMEPVDLAVTSELPSTSSEPFSTEATVSVTPNPAGINQQIIISGTVTPAPPEGYFYQDILFEVTRPDGTSETLGPLTSESNGTACTPFTPTITGTYTVSFVSREQAINGDLYLESDTSVTEFTVQENVPTVGGAAPTAYFTVNRAPPESDEVLLFDASNSKDTDGSIVNYSWDFGDGTTGAEMIAMHTYELAGNYSVVLTVTDNDGLTASTTRTIDDMVPELASIPKPSVPEFSLKFVDNSYDFPATYSIDPFTGENVTHAGYRVENKSVEVWINNQQFTAYSDENSIYELYYNVRYKGHFEDRWCDSSSDNYIYPLDAEYAVISYFLGDNELEIAPGGQIDFQVEALLGDYVRIHDESVTPWGVSSWHIFLGETSGWSDTQTLTINATDQIATPDEPEIPDETSNQMEQLPDNLVVAAIVIAVTVVGAGLLVYFKMYKH